MTMRPSPETYITERSISALYLKRAMTEETMLDAENRIATIPAIREMSSIPGRVRSVTDALRMTAACKRYQHAAHRCRMRDPTTRHAQPAIASIGPLCRMPLSSSSLRDEDRLMNRNGIPRHKIAIMISRITRVNGLRV